MVSKFANITYQPGLDLQVEIGKMRDKFAEKFHWRKACPTCKDDIGMRSYCKNQHGIIHYGICRPNQTSNGTYF